LFWMFTRLFYIAHCTFHIYIEYMIREAIIDFIFPKTCVGCGVWGSFLCKGCQERLDFVEQICPMCGEESLMGWTHPKCRTRHGMDGLIAIYEYQEPVARAVVDSIKYGFNRGLMGVVLNNFTFETGVNFDFLVPVPLYFYRENWRGFNQAEELGKVIGSKLMVPVENVLARMKNTKQQALMKTREERQKNIENAFVADCRFQKSDIKGKKILLVDDVFTSGADMRECTKVLKKAGAEVVWGLALAH